MSNLFPRATSQVAACRHLATAARVKYPAALQRCKFDTPLLAAGSLIQPRICAEVSQILLIAEQNLKFCSRPQRKTLRNGGKHEYSDRITE